MATVRLRGHVSEEGDLPDVCMKCGAPATVYKYKTFSRLPGWVYVLLILGLLGVFLFFILVLTLTKRRRVCVPLCEQHRNHWLIREVVLAVSFVALVVMGFVALVGAIDRPAPEVVDETLGAVLCVSTLVGMLGWVVLAVVLHLTSIRAVEITERVAVLEGVAHDFVDAYEDLLDRDAEWLDRAARERWERRGRRYPEDEPEGHGRYRRREEDEDEDEPPRRGSDRYRPRD